MIRKLIVLSAMASLYALSTGSIAAAKVPAGYLPPNTIAEEEVAGFGVSLNGFGGRIVWNHYNPSTGEYELMTSTGGPATPVPVASRKRPVTTIGSTFDVDLGPDSRGHVVAVYSRCKVGATAQTYGDCDIYKFDFSTAEE